ncbi:MAG: transporter [Deltaproteobacteria bacterium]|nr:MAG: transporter [Deltaproteobacteria bacterium]
MRRLIVLMLALLLTSAGCTMGPDYVRPPVPQHPAYRNQNPPGRSIADLEWWKIFNDPVLIKLIDTALENNLNLRVAMARIEVARAQLGIARADLYPNAIYGGSATHTAQTKLKDTSAATGSVNISYIVDLWGEVRRSNEAALHQLLGTEEAYRTITIALVAQVAKAYFQLRSIDKHLDISERTVETRRKSLDIVRTRYEAGMVSEVDFQQARIQLTNAEASVVNFSLSRAKTENAISLLLGSPPISIPRGRSIDAQTLPVEVPAGVPSELVERRPDVRQAEQLLAAQTARIGVAEAARFPSLTLSADLGGSATDTIDTIFANLAASLLGPLFDAGKSKQRVEVEVARTKQLLAQYKQSILSAFREVEDALAAVRLNKSRYEILQRQVAAAQAATNLTWTRYQEGMTSFLEVLDIERSLFSSELGATDAQEQYVTAIVQLYQALGGGWNPKQSPPVK